MKDKSVKLTNVVLDKPIPVAKTDPLAELKKATDRLRKLLEGDKHEPGSNTTKGRNTRGHE